MPSALTLANTDACESYFCKENVPILYSDLILTEQLLLYLHEVDRTAYERLELIQKWLYESDPAPSKANNRMVWVQYMKKCGMA